MAERPLAVEQILDLLAATPRHIEALSANLTAAQLQSKPSRDEWSANDVLAHLRACADIWGGCVATIVAQDHPTIRAVNPRSWIKQTDYPELDFHASLAAFARQRSELLALLERLPPNGWTRAARVTGAGRPLVRTVHSYAQWLARHERPHVKQVERVVASLRRQ